MLKKTISFIRSNWPAILTLLGFCVYTICVNRINVVLLLLTVVNPLLKLVLDHLREKGMFRKASRVKRVGDVLVIKELFGKVSVDINNVRSVRMMHNLYSRTFDLKILEVHTLHNEHIRIYVNEEDAYTITNTIAASSDTQYRIPGSIV